MTSFFAADPRTGAAGPDRARAVAAARGEQAGLRYDRAAARPTARPAAPDRDRRPTARPRPTATDARPRPTPGRPAAPDRAAARPTARPRRRPTARP